MNKHYSALPTCFWHAMLFGFKIWHCLKVSSDSWIFPSNLWINAFKYSPYSDFPFEFFRISEITFMHSVYSYGNLWVETWSCVLHAKKAHGSTNSSFHEYLLLYFCLLAAFSEEILEEPLPSIQFTCSLNTYDFKTTNFSIN